MKYTAVETSEVASDRDDHTETTLKSRESKTTIKLGCACAAFAFCVNLGLLIWTLIKFHVEEDGIVAVFSGSCSKAKSISIWSHLAINVLSSALFAASNNCMQFLTAPSREEVDEAHRRSRRLDIGVHTVRNLRNISRTRVLLWACLGLSSLPLHVLYNSAVFEATGASSYTVLTASTEFINGGYWNSTRAQCSDTYNLGTDRLDVHLAVQYLQSNVKSLVRLENAACIEAYGPEFEGKYDAITLGFGAMSAEYSESKRIDGQTTGYVWKGERKFGFNAPSPTRWFICNILFILFWVSAFLLLWTGNAHSNSGTLGFSALAANGIGRLNTEYLIAFNVGDGFTSNVILANTPQVCISFLYLFYNDLFTRIYLSKEWSSYSRLRKPLRVRQPKGVQRSTYFLSLPWRISIPLLIIMMALHWLISQSIFLALVQASDYGSGGRCTVESWTVTHRLWLVAVCDYLVAYRGRCHDSLALDYSDRGSVRESDASCQKF